MRKDAPKTIAIGMDAILEREERRRHNQREKYKLQKQGRTVASKGPRGKILDDMDSTLAEQCKHRDEHVCRAHLALSGGKDRHAANVVHHIERKKTHRGVDVRFLTGYQVSLCHEAHADAHAQNGPTSFLDIDVIDPGEGPVSWKFTQYGQSAEVPNVSNYNPFEVEAE